MLSRIFWVAIAGIALVAGMAMQDGRSIFSWGDHDGDISRKTEQAVADSVDRAVEGSFDKMTVTGSDGEEIDVPPETKRALGEAVGRLVKAETDLAMLRIRDGGEKEIEAANVRRDRAKADVERLKDQIERQQDLSEASRDALREEIRDDIRETVRDVVRN